MTYRERQAKAIELRVAGYTYDQIAKTLGFAHRQGAHKAVSFALRNRRNVAVDELRELERMRLDELQRSLYQLARAGNFHAFDRILKLIQTRMRLEGLEAPRQLRHDIGTIDQVSLSVIDQIIQGAGLEESEA